MYHSSREIQKSRGPFIWIKGGRSRAELKRLLAIGMILLRAKSLEAQEDTTHAPNTRAAESVAARFYIREYRVEGAHHLSRIELEKAVYPFMGPGRTAADVENARAALEKAFQDAGYQTVSVSVPQQAPARGIIILQVNEAKVGKLRIKGSRYFDQQAIRAKAQSMAEGKVVNFNDLTREIVALNQWPDRQITPSLRAGEVPGTVDVDLTVKDKFPLHGNIELNNRYSANTTQLRINGSISYNNLWQLGHTLGGSFQLAPENIKDTQVYSVFYTARFPNIDWLSISIQGTKQDSNVSTLGAIDVVGKGQILGLRAIVTLPPGKDFFQSLNFGIDYKHFNQDVTIGDATITAPVTYYPISANYNATWIGKGYLTEFDISLIFHLRGMGSNPSELDNSRFKADSSFIYLRGDLSHSRDLPYGFQIYGKVQGQIADQPLLSAEQIAGGGLSTVRGYLESETIGDNGAFGTLELRSPTLLPFLDEKNNEWRIYAFGDAGLLSIYNPLPEQTSRFYLASFGGGSRIRLADHFNGSIDLGVPLISQSPTIAWRPRVTFRIWADF